MLKIVGGGAVKGLVDAMAQSFRMVAGIDVGGRFGAVGAMRRELEGGTPADIVMLTRTIMDDLVREGRAIGETLQDIGGVPTSVAVRSGDEEPQIGDAQALRAALRSVDAIYLPDPKQATAGIHFAGVIDRLGLTDEVGGRLRPFPNGATAMRELASSSALRPIGCTQASEIIATPGVELVGDLPDGFDLITVYSAAVARDAAMPDAARQFIALLAAREAEAERRRCGFVNA